MQEEERKQTDQPKTEKENNGEKKRREKKECKERKREMRKKQKLWRKREREKKNCSAGRLAEPAGIKPRPKHRKGRPYRGSQRA